MWRERAASVIPALYACLSIGNTVAPLVTAPFLSHSNNVTTSEDCHERMMTSHVNSSHADTDSRMFIPYSIAGAWAALMALAFTVLYFTNRQFYVSRERAEEGGSSVPLRTRLNPASCADGSFAFGLVFIAVTSLCFVLVNARDRGYAMFVFTISNQGLRASKPTASLVLFSYNMTATVARLLCALLSIWIPIQIVVTSLVISAATVFTLLHFFGLQSLRNFWMLSCAAALCIAPAHPALTAWANKYIDVTGVVMGLFNVGCGLGGLGGMYFSGFLFQRFHSSATVQLAMFVSIALAVAFLPLQIASHLRGSRSPRSRSVDVTPEAPAADEEVDDREGEHDILQEEEDSHLIS